VRRIAWVVDALLCLLLLYFYLPELTGEMRERLISPSYWLARLRGEHLMTRNGVLWRGDPTQPVIALTFGDGPDPETTPRILDILLLHDTYPHTADTLPELIRQLKARGYRFATIPEMVQMLSQHHQACGRGL